MFARETKILFRKEWRQLLRSKGALLSALLLPALLLVIIPGTQLVAGAKSEENPFPEGVKLPPGLQALSEDPSSIGVFMMPLMVMLAGLIVPMIGASYTLISERESKTLELLVALPVTVRQIVTAKFMALVLLASAVTMALLMIDVVLLFVAGKGSVLLVLGLMMLLIASIALATCGAFLISLLAKDFRTANNLNGLIVVPAMFLTFGVMALVPGPAWTAMVTAFLCAVGAAVVLWIALRVVTFERLLR